MAVRPKCRHRKPFSHPNPATRREPLILQFPPARAIDQRPRRSRRSVDRLVGDCHPIAGEYNEVNSPIRTKMTAI